MLCEREKVQERRICPRAQEFAFCGLCCSKNSEINSKEPRGLGCNTTIRGVTCFEKYLKAKSSQTTNRRRCALLLVRTFCFYLLPLPRRIACYKTAFIICCACFALLCFSFVCPLGKVPAHVTPAVIICCSSETSAFICVPNQGLACNETTQQMSPRLAPAGNRPD
jgi:hypothetical protein